MASIQPTRQVILDTETTGLSPDEGHRIIEVGCLELVDRRPTGRTLHHYINPERLIDARAKEIHGISEEQLADKPLFAALANEILEFVRGAEVLIHNASFDVGFLNAELARLNAPMFHEVAGSITDTLLMARELHPGKRNSLDSLCDRYGISNAHRKLHGALLDAELLAEVFLAMTRGQDSLDMSANHSNTTSNGSGRNFQEVDWPPAGLRVIQLAQPELEAHGQMLAGMQKEAKGGVLWEKLRQV
jgi:DNA polymerase III subunit epsilon